MKILMLILMWLVWVELYARAVAEGDHWAALVARMTISVIDTLIKLLSG